MYRVAINAIDRRTAAHERVPDDRAEAERVGDAPSWVFGPVGLCAIFACFRRQERHIAERIDHTAIKHGADPPFALNLALLEKRVTNLQRRYGAIRCKLRVAPLCGNQIGKRAIIAQAMDRAGGPASLCRAQRLSCMRFELACLVVLTNEPVERLALLLAQPALLVFFVFARFARDAWKATFT